MAATGIRQRRQVRVWFGEHVIVNKTDDEDYAERFAESMRRRFSSLQVTNDPVPPKASPSKDSWQSGPC